MHANKFGVPQIRKRAFILARKKDINFELDETNNKLYSLDYIDDETEKITICNNENKNNNDEPQQDINININININTIILI